MFPSVTIWPPTLPAGGVAVLRGGRPVVDRVGARRRPGCRAPWRTSGRRCCPGSRCATASVGPPNWAEPTESSPVRLFWNGWADFEKVVLVAAAADLDACRSTWPGPPSGRSSRRSGTGTPAPPMSVGMSWVGTVRKLLLIGGKSVERLGSWVIETTLKFLIAPLTTRVTVGVVSGPVGIVPRAVRSAKAVSSYDVL